MTRMMVGMTKMTVVIPAPVLDGLKDRPRESAQAGGIHSQSFELVPAGTNSSGIGLADLFGAIVFALTTIINSWSKI